jgi:hypothetical protein
VYDTHIQQSSGEGSLRGATSPEEKCHLWIQSEQPPQPSTSTGAQHIKVGLSQRICVIAMQSMMVYAWSSRQRLTTERHDIRNPDIFNGDSDDQHVLTVYSGRKRQYVRR